MKKFLLLVVIVCLGLSTAFAQELTTKGSIGGQVKDPSGASIAGATVIVTGPKGAITVTSNDDGVFEVRNLDPGYYAVTVEQTGFKKTSIERVEVVVGKQNTITASLEVGGIGEVVTVTDVAQIDQTSTAVGSNLSDQIYENIPVQRNVQSLFYLAPGVSDSLQGGGANPSIAGGSALDNLYIADGVNITDSAFGGLGVFSRVYGTLGTGINTSYIKEVQVKTGGFEPQYGQTTGGIINIITKSGGNEYHGAVYGYARPKQLEADRKLRDDFSRNKVGSILNVEQYDVGAEFGGYVPGLRDHLFFFGTFNPSITRNIALGAHRNAFDIANGRPASDDSGIFNLLGEHSQRYRTYNYAAKLDLVINENHSFNFSIFGDPTITNASSHRSLAVQDLTAIVTLDFGTRNMAARYNGAFGSTNPLTMSVSLTRGQNEFNEIPLFNIYQITDQTQAATRGVFIAQGLGFLENTKSVTDSFNIDVTKQVDFLGTHNLGVGYKYQKGNYSGVSDRSGVKFNIPSTNLLGIPTENFTGIPAALGPGGVIGQPSNATFNLVLVPVASRVGSPTECTLCPLLNIPGRGDERVTLQQTRGNFGEIAFDTASKYHAAYVQDTWRFNKYITALLGLRQEQERIIGSPFILTGARSAYSFTGQWSPRVGVTVDPTGQGKMKVYYNFGRFFEFLPLDAAQRSLSAEQSVSYRYIPDFTIDANGDRRAIIGPFGTVVPVLDAAHLISGVPFRDPVTGAVLGGLGANSATAPFTPFRGTVSANDPGNILLAGSKLGYKDEHLVGFEMQLPRNFVLSVRYQDRRIKRIIEDAAAVSVEQANGGLFGQAYVLANVNSQTDFAVNPIPFVFPTGGAIPQGCVDVNGDVHGVPGEVPYLVEGVTDADGNDLGSICFAPDPNAGNFIPGGDGIPDGFPDPVSIYRGLEVEVNKRFADNWQLFSNVRFSSLRGNYEGHFRNDNGQTDPGISSLFDFTEGEFNLLGTQFAVGPLNTDRRVIANIYGSYTFGKEGFGSRFDGLTLGATLHGESGYPISEFLAHPVYVNAGEIPVGGRGKIGRSSPFYRLDLKFDYPWMISETSKLSFTADFFNVFNNTPIRQPNEFRQLNGGLNNVDFLAPRNYYAPFNLRVGMKFEF